jgi:hypothetical protein
MWPIHYHEITQMVLSACRDQKWSMCPSSIKTQRMGSLSAIWIRTQGHCMTHSEWVLRSRVSSWFNSLCLSCINKFRLQIWLLIILCNFYHMCKMKKTISCTHLLSFHLSEVCLRPFNLCVFSQSFMADHNVISKILIWTFMSNYWYL